MKGYDDTMVDGIAKSLEGEPTRSLFDAYVALEGDLTTLGEATTILNRLSEKDRHTLWEAFRVSGRIAGGDGLGCAAGMCATMMLAIQQAARKDPPDRTDDT